MLTKCAKGSRSSPRSERPNRTPNKKTAPFDPGEFENRYVEALRKLIDKKAKSKSGKKIIEDVEEPTTGGSGNVIDLMAALKKSVGSGDKAGARKPAARKAPAKKAAPRKKSA